VQRTLATLVAAGAASLAVVAPAGARPISKPTTLRGVVVTEYFPIPEAWFNGKRVAAPGLSAPHRIDWLYSARGLLMEGEGIGLDGRYYHAARFAGGGWIDRRGRSTRFGGGGRSSDPPYWYRERYWRDRRGYVTYPLERGGWAHGRGVRRAPARGSTFAAGASRRLAYWRSVAVDPSLIALGSALRIPAYGRWFCAQDTGGAIDGRHVDVFRPPPAERFAGGRTHSGQRVRVIPPRDARRLGLCGNPGSLGGGGSGGSGGAGTR